MAHLPRRYLAAHGVRHITLLGRSGHITDQLRSSLESLLSGEGSGCITIARCDTASTAELVTVMDVDMKNGVMTGRQSNYL
jgi:hypothetical protein